MKTVEKKLAGIKRQCLASLLALHKKADAGHIASSLSCLDILIYLFFFKMKKGDKLVLSKGHAAGALYTVLAEKGLISPGQLSTFCSEGTRFPAHPAVHTGVPEIAFATGSLGHGLSLACGKALSTHYTKKNFQVYAVLSDGDCNEGSTWEAALFAAHRKLDNLTAIIDNNGLQAFGRTKDVLQMEPLADKWKAFNFNTASAKDGNKFSDLDKAFAKLKRAKNSRPNCLIAKTTKGSGVSYMEDRMEWHYLPMSDAEYAKALAEIEKRHA